MCTVSMVGDVWMKQYPQYAPSYPNPLTTTWTYIPPAITREEFNKLKAEVENLKKLLQLAKAMDDAAGTPDCEMEEKIALIKRVAEAVGVDLSDVFVGRIVEHQDTES